MERHHSGPKIGDFIGNFIGRIFGLLRVQALMHHSKENNCDVCLRMESWRI